ncbi:MAG: nucleotidyltransferase, partial [Nitrosopumilaceae archaeon]|nr:nucleotidyltransferase [Nitrosopumilaceae archaeon]NIU88440.1 nucleotidyltransferase [Nitrosopumilaceae archaeon]NIV66344.1 nucleotidyltransferase [Nitrosopumilaceae archaeon]NIX60031.1 nucleotidyltransferase [Nitrosopumilaceae archaeon]
SLPKFMKLAGDCNPNIIEILFTDRNKEIFSTPIFEKLYANRALFLSTKARHTFAGYAFAQLKRIKSHREWLLNPPSHKPTREEFGLNDAHKINKSVMGAFD